MFVRASLFLSLSLSLSPYSFSYSNEVRYPKFNNINTIYNNMNTNICTCINNIAQKLSYVTYAKFIYHVIIIM